MSEITTKTENGVAPKQSIEGQALEVKNYSFENSNWQATHHSKVEGALAISKVLNSLSSVYHTKGEAKAPYVILNGVSKEPIMIYFTDEAKEVLNATGGLISKSKHEVQKRKITELATGTEYFRFVVAAVGEKPGQRKPKFAE